MDSKFRITIEFDRETTQVCLGPRLGETLRSFLILLDMLALQDGDYQIRLDLDESICEESLRRAA